MYKIVCAQGNPRNFMFVAHWNNFQSVRSCQCGCWTLEIYVLNDNKDFYLCIFSIMYIYIISIKFIEGSSAMISR